MGLQPSRLVPKGWSIILGVVVALGIPPVDGVVHRSAAAAPGPTLQAAPPAAAPRQVATVFAVERFGRYAVTLASVKGAALQLIDRMAGPEAEDGVAGERDGRIDLFLGPGSHKAVMSFAPGEPNPPELAVQPFQELNQGTPPQLVELALVQTELGDVQQRSYWLDIRQRRTVFIEAAGRHLQDLRLWKDGTWLEEARPTASRSERRPGQPLAVRQLIADLGPGLYLLTAYGGDGETWTEAEAANPLVLRWGIPALPETGRRAFVTGPFGFDRWLVPPAASDFRLEVPRGETGDMDVATLHDGVVSDPAHAGIDRTTRGSAIGLSRQPLSRGAAHLVTVRRPVGSPYVLQHYVAVHDAGFTVPGDADYLIGTLRPGHGEDDVDLTAVLTGTTGGAGKAEASERIIARQTIRLGHDSPWRRRFTLPDPVSLFVDVTQPGGYKVETTGVDAEVQWQPFALTGGPDRAPPPQPGGGVWDLDAGLYVLRVLPRAGGRGIVGLSLHGEASPEAAEPSPPLPGASFAPLRLQRDVRYRLSLNEAPGSGFGMVKRLLPADLTEDLPLVLAAGESRTLPVSLPATGMVQAPTDDGTALPLSLDGASATGQVTAAAGAHAAHVTNPTPAPVIASLRFQAGTPPAAAELSPLPAESLGKLPGFPVLEAGTPRFLDLRVSEDATFAVKVGTPALYRVETTGLLQTSGALRTQVQPSLAQASANGVGRNMLLQQYLREGLYRLTVGTEGDTFGHLGVTLTASPMRDGGALTPGLPARVTLGPGEGVIYTFDVPEPGPYRLQALSLAGATAIRLEDAEGWPLTTPDQTGDLRRDMEPGRYRLVVLPQPLPGRLLTLVESERTPPAPVGHGPHPLPLDGSVANRWEEPADGGPRRPDVWSFALSAECDLAITLGDLMQGELRRDGEAQPVASLSFREPWHGRLAAGAWHLDVRSVRPDNRLDYTVATAVTQLIPGHSRTVTAPALVPVALGDDQRVEISSFGTGEVRATLLDAAGVEVARSGARPDDWNFNITARLPAGHYRLKVDPLAGAAVTTTVSLRQLAEVVDAALAAPGDRTLTDGLLHAIPLELKPGDGPLVVTQARSADPVGLALERRTPDGVWQTVGTTSGRAAHLALARDPAAPEVYRLQVWSLDHTRLPIALALRAVAPPPFPEPALAAGLDPVAVPGLEPALGVAVVRLERPGLFQLDAPAPGLIWSAAGDGRVLANGPQPVVAGGESLWFLEDLTAGRLRGHRVTPDGGVPLSLTLPAAETVALPVAPGPSGPRLWLAESRLGQPGLAVGPRSGVVDGRRSGLAAGVAAAVLPDAGAPEAAAIRLWRADAGTGDLSLVLRQFSFAAPTLAALDWGEGDRALEAGAAVELSLPSGPKRLRLALPSQVAAALVRDGAVDRLLWSEGPGTTQSLDSAADRLLLLNAGPAAGRLSVTLTPTGEGTGGLTLSRGVMLRQAVPTAGTLLVEVPLTDSESGQGLVVHLSGPVTEALLLQRDGTVRSDTGTLAVAGPAVLLLRHGPGALAAWLGNGDERDWLEAAGKAPAQPVPATLALSGAETAWRFEAPQPALLHLTSAVPVLSGVLRPGGAPPELTVWPEGANLHLFLAGDGTGSGTIVGLRPLQQGSLAGAVRIVRSEAVPIGDGRGPKLRLAPGDARLFGFVLSEAGAVGVGVRSDADSARVRLLEPTGRVLAEGTVAMSELPAGRYFLEVENRSDAATTDIQPVLVGVTRPGHGPPEDVKRHYWDLVTEPEDGQHHEN